MSSIYNYKYSSQNDNRTYNNEQFLKELVTIISAKMGRKLQNNEKKTVIEYVLQMNPRVFLNKSKADVISEVSTHFVNSVFSKKNDEETINIHEILKNEIGVSTGDMVTNTQRQRPGSIGIPAVPATMLMDIGSILGFRSMSDLQKVFMPSLVKRFTYILLDTRYRILENSGTRSFSWNFINNEIINQGTVNAIGSIRDITCIRIYPIKIPFVRGASNIYSRVTMFIEEFAAQSFIAQENRRFHFMFSTHVSGNWVFLSPDSFNDGFFRFRNPITRLETFTVSFGSPLQPIVFDNDRVSATITDTSNYGISLSIDFEFEHGLETGEVVFISGFTTVNPNIDGNVIRQVNNQNGIVVNVIDVNTISIDVDTTSIISLTNPGTVTVTNGSDVVTGVGTQFRSLFSTNDIIKFSGPSYTVKEVTSNTRLILDRPYGEISGNPAYQKDNTIPNLVIQIYFGSRRIFIPMEIEYYQSNINA